MSINRIHRKQHNFSMIDNEAAEAKNLSWGARGLLWYLLTKPDNWELKTEHLANQSEKEGKKRVLTLIRELEMAGYIIRWSERGDRGRIEWYNEIFECLNDKNEWLKKNQERISKCFSLSKGTSAMYPEKAHGQKTSKAHSGNDVSTIPTMHPSRIDGEPIDGQTDSGDWDILINTDVVTTESVSTELVMEKIKENDFFQKSAFPVENGFSDPTSAQIEALRAELETREAKELHSPSTLVLVQREEVPPPHENGSQVIKTAADVKPALDKLCPAMAKKEYAKHQGDAFEMFWTLFNAGWKSAGTDFPASPGTKAPTAKSWDALFKGSKHPEELSQAIIQGAELFWEAKRANGVRSALSAAVFLSNGHWKAAIEQSKSQSNSQPAQQYADFLTCWNQDRPMRWPNADQGDLSPKCVGRLEELIASCDNSLERFQKALLWCKRDRHWGLERSLTFEEFLYSGQINNFYKKQVHDESLGAGDRIMDAKDIKKEQAELKRKRELVISLRDSFLRGEVTREIFDEWMAKKGLDPDAVLAGNL